jgi:hypothetical protein
VSGPPLTPAQQQRLDELNPVRRAQVLTWLATGDPILVGEARRVLAPCRAAQPPPRDLAELIARRGEDPAYAPLLAKGLAVELGDPTSFAYYWKVAHQAAPGALLEALRQSRNPEARAPAKVFVHALKRAVGSCASAAARTERA